MPLILPANIPAFNVLKENVFIMDTKRANSQDIRALELLIVNLMPTKIETENQLLSLLGNSPLQINVSLLCTQTYIGKNTPLSHLQKFYINLDQIKNKKFDGAIVTGAPVEKLAYEEVNYWEEFKQIIEFLNQNCTSTFYICWGAMAALYHFYQIPKKNLNQKIFGIFKHQKTNKDPLLNNLNENPIFPHSRYSSLEDEWISQNNNLQILLHSQELGACLIKDSKNVFLLAHPEYQKNTLELEYERDKNINIDPPKNYYNSKNEINFIWRADANTLFTNWLNYYVYQNTPYNLNL